MSPSIDDPFGTAQVRKRVLEAWTASPARFREDANAEEDLVLGGYRDRLLIELAQNAADAASAAGVPGHLRLTLTGGTLRAANVGAPLDAAAVQGLATLRASAKTGSGSVGRYGVGFAAVLAVTDEPSVVSRSGGVRFSAADTRAAAAAIPSLATELQRRSAAAHGSVPVLRLPFPIEDSADGPPEGFDTEVRLPLRAGVEDAVRSLLDDLQADVLLGLPGLSRMDVDGRILSRSEDGRDVLISDGDIVARWRVSRARGELSTELLAGRPVEEQERPEWNVAWAVPIGGDGLQPLSGQQVIHAPTPSDEPLSLPVRLVASYPLGPDRRHVAPGPVTDHLTVQAARAYGDLLASLADDPAVLRMIPRVSLAAATLDAAISTAITTELRGLAWLPEAHDAESAGVGDPVAGREAVHPGRVRPDRATALDPSSDSLVAVLADVLDGLLPAPWSRRGDKPALTALGVRWVDLAGVIDLLSTVDRPPQWWGRVYAALETLGPVEDRDALAGIPVPLSDGRTAFGARGLLLAGADLRTAELGALGLSVVQPEAVEDDAARGFLERLGAVPATGIGVLTSGAVRAAVEASFDAEDPEPTARAVLALVQAAGTDAGSHPWLTDLALPDNEGEWAPAGELVLPGSRLDAVLDPTALGRVEPDLVASVGTENLVAVGVLATFAVLREGSQDLVEPDHDLDDESRWYEALFDRLPPSRRPPVLADFVAVRDLDLIRPECWPDALAMLAELSGDVFADAVVALDVGESIAVPSYTRWWLSTHPVLAGQRPDRLRHPDAMDLVGLFEAADAAPEILEILGCLTTAEATIADPATALEVLERLGAPERTVRADVLSDIYPRLAVALDGIQTQPPTRVRISPERTVPRSEAVVVDAPFLLPLIKLSAVPAPIGPAAVADLLDLRLASEIVTASLISSETSRSLWSDIPGAAVAARRLGVGSLPGQVAEHDPLTVSQGRRVTWWPGADLDHVDIGSGPEALGRALAWRHGRWAMRAALAEAFAHPHDNSRLDAEDGIGD